MTAEEVEEARQQSREIEMWRTSYQNLVVALKLQRMGVLMVETIYQSARVFDGDLGKAWEVPR